MCMSGRKLQLLAREQVLEEVDPLLEAAGLRRRVEDHVAQLAPVIALVLPARDAHGALKLLASQPQFAVERIIRQAVEEPVRRIIDVSVAREELLAVPVGADAVELLAHPPAAQVRDV